MGIALTFPFILASGPILGYFIGQHVFVARYNAPGYCVALLVGLGFLGSILQIISLIKKINAIEAQELQQDL